MSTTLSTHPPKGKEKSIRYTNSKILFLKRNLSYGSFFLVISLLSEWSIENTHSVKSIFWKKSLAWDLWFNTNTWIVLLIKLKVLALVTLIDYITNYVTSIILIIFWYYLLDPVANLWKQSHLERYLPVPLEESLFYQIHTLITDLCVLLVNLKISITMSRA